MRYDLHCHTIYSKHWMWGVDAINTPRDMIKGAIKKGLSGFAITDHDNVKGSLVAKKIAKDIKKDFLIITGAEIRTADGDVIALGIKEDVPGMRPIIETVEKIHNLGGISIAAHPYAKFLIRTCVGEKGKNADAIEVLNSGSSTKWFDHKALMLARKYKKPMTAGSDAHYWKDVGNAGIICDGDPLEAIRKNNTKIFGVYTPYSHTAFVAARKVMRIVKWKFVNKPEEIR